MNNDINQEILGELRKLRRNHQAATWLAVAVIIAAVAYVAVLQREQRRYRETSQAARQAQPRPWDEVDAAMDRLDYPKALSLAHALAALRTNYYYGHAYLGNIYLALGQATNAEAHYLRAYELWPDDDNEKSLAAIRRCLTHDRGESPSK